MASKPLGKGTVPLLDPALCRCCRHIKRCRLLTAEYEFEQQKEIYSDMFLDCFGLVLSNLDVESECGICATCVLRLRDASAFHKQVLTCEEILLTAKLKRDIDKTAEEFVVKREEASDHESMGEDIATMNTEDIETKNIDEEIKVEETSFTNCALGTDQSDKASPNKEKVMSQSELENNVKKLQEKLDAMLDNDNRDTCDLMLKNVVKKEAIEIDDIVHDTTATDANDIDLSILTNPKVASELEGIIKTAKKRPISKMKSKNIILVPTTKVKEIPGIPAASSGMKLLKIGNRPVYVKVHKEGKPNLSWQLISQNCKKDTNRLTLSGINDTKQSLNRVNLPVRIDSTLALRSDLSIKRTLINKGIKSNDTKQSLNRVNLPVRIDSTLALRSDLNIKRTLINKGIKTKHRILATKKSSTDKGTQSDRLRKNRECLLLCSTLYPFRLPVCGLVSCVYCKEKNIEPADYRAHIDEHHSETVDPKKACNHVNGGGINELKVECSELKCRICNKSFDTIEIIAKHLKEDHNKNIDLSIDLGVVPFNFKNSGALACAVCQKQFINVLTLSKHTSTHYSRFTCDKCGKNFSFPSTLKAHQTLFHVDKPICARCKTTFESRKELKVHRENTYTCRTHGCSECSERFVSKAEKLKHISSVHGRKQNTYCRLCQKEFRSRYSYNYHNFKEHVTNCPKCAICDKKFENAKKLSEHMSIHTGAKPYQCERCNKSYGTKKALKQHIRINHKHQFSCEECKKHFGCKSSMTNHMLNCH